mgnify:CR=1 FL=1
MSLSEMNTLIWDWNGTLLDDVNANVEVINKMLLKRSLPLLELNRYKDIFCFPVKQFHIRIGIDFNKESIEEVSAEYMELYKSYESSLELNADVPFILDWINSKSINQYILSAAGKDDLLRMLGHFQLTGKFKGIYGSGDICATGKVEIGRKLMEDNALNPDKTLIIGDTLHDAEVAKALGVNCILYAGGHNSYDLLKSESEVITSLKDMKFA